MKKIPILSIWLYSALFLLLLLLPLQQINAQDKTIATFRITEAKQDDVDKSQWYFDRKQNIIFYWCSNGSLCMSNKSGVSDEQSYGELIPSAPMQHIDETSTTYSTDIFTFRWHYFNTYNAQNGWSSLILQKVYKPQGIVFNIKMILANLETLTYTGYMEGSLDFSQLFH